MRPNNEKPGQAIELYMGCGAIRQANRATTLCEEDSVFRRKYTENIKRKINK
jgi:hypothetical protein